MQLVSLQMRGSVARNYIFSLILEMLWSETGYFGLLGNKHSLYIILFCIIERYRYIGFKKCIWEDPTGTMMSVGRFYWNNGVSGTMVLIVQDMILW